MGSTVKPETVVGSDEDEVCEVASKASCFCLAVDEEPIGRRAQQSWEINARRRQLNPFKPTAVPGPGDTIWR